MPLRVRPRGRERCVGAPRRRRQLWTPQPLPPISSPAGSSGHPIGKKVRVCGVCSCARVRVCVCAYVCVRACVCVCVCSGMNITTTTTTGYEKRPNNSHLLLELSDSAVFGFVLLQPLRLNLLIRPEGACMRHGTWTRGHKHTNRKLQRGGRETQMHAH